MRPKREVWVAQGAAPQPGETLPLPARPETTPRSAGAMRGAAELFAGRGGEWTDKGGEKGDTSDEGGGRGREPGG
eukprot:7100912-Pyramimonas_sp.AAC.1